MLPSYLGHLKPDRLVELNTGHLYLDNSPVATKKLPWGMLSGKDVGGGRAKDRLCPLTLLFQVCAYLHSPPRMKSFLSFGRLPSNFK